MANQEQVELLKQEVAVWNAWRRKHPEVQPDLSSANLNFAHLGSAYLYSAHLSFANLSSANFNNTYLNNTNVHETRLFHTILAAIDLCMVKGLNTTIHEGPSYVDVNTDRLPEGEVRISPFSEELDSLNPLSSICPHCSRLPSSMSRVSSAMLTKTNPWPNASIRICKPKGCAVVLLSTIFS